jgi:hypothetical protein
MRSTISSAEIDWVDVKIGILRQVAPARSVAKRMAS